MPDNSTNYRNARDPFDFPFAAQADLLQLFIRRRADIVERIEQLLNCQKKPIDYQQNQSLLSRQFKDCCFTLSGLTQTQTGLRDQLELAHWASGFKPRANPGNDIIDPAALMVRGFHMWQQTRWPGQKGRIRFAQTLLNVYLLRCVTLLLMRLWDDAVTDARNKLGQVQSLLDALWHSSPTDQPVLVRDVRWLFPVAMSPTTNDLSGYFRITQLIDDTLPPADRIEIHKASVQAGSGHLRAQLRHLAVQQGVQMDAHELVLLTRVSNALDVALLMQGLVTLLRAYEQAIAGSDGQQRLSLAAAICEGLSPDPELFIKRLDLLGPYTMIEHLFIATDKEGNTAYTSMGMRHLQLLQEYKGLIGRLANSLHDDCPHSRPVAEAYSPYGLLYGFASNILELTAFKTLQLDAETRFTMEDAFAAGAADKRAWVNGWRTLPHIKPEVVQQFEYPAQFAADMHARIEQQLQQRVAAGDSNSSVPTGKLYLLQANDPQVAGMLPHICELPVHYIHASDPALVAARMAESKELQDILFCRLEGEYVVSYRTEQGCVGITKDMLTEVVGAGKDARLAGLPQEAVDVLRLMCPELVVTG